MRRFTKKHVAIGLVVALVLVLAGVVAARQLWPRTSSAPLRASGGTAWNTGRTIGVRVVKGGVIHDTTVVFSKPKVTPKEAPAMALMDVIVPAVDITPAGSIGENQTQVVFKVPPSVPLAPDPQHKRMSIQNAGIEVYNTSVQAWIPLETTVEGNTLVALAPHFSEYRAVVLKSPGDYLLDLGNKFSYAITDSLRPDLLLWRTGVEFLKSMYNAVSGTFDAEKMEACDKEPSKEYTATVNTPPTDPTKAGVCVVDDHGANTIMLKNAWSFPMRYETDAGKGVTAQKWPSDFKVTTLVRDKIAGLIGDNVAIASGLDVGRFTIGDEAPESIKVQGRISMTATAIDFVVATFTAFFPEGMEVVEQAGLVLDIAGCVSTVAAKITTVSLTGLPGQMAEIMKDCALPKYLAAHHVPEMANVFVKEARVIPEFMQTVQVLANGITGKDTSAASFTIDNANEQLKWLVGNWGYHCPGSDKYLTIGKDLKGHWQDMEYTGDNGATTQSTVILFHVTIQAGKPVFIIDNRPTIDLGLRIGQVLTVKKLQGGQWFILNIGDDTGDFEFFKNDGGNYC